MSKHDPEYMRCLVARCIDGENAAWRELMGMLEPVVQGVCRNRGLFGQDALDILSVTYLILLQNMKNLREPENIISYGAKTASRAALHLKMRDGRLEEILREDLSGFATAEQAPPDKAMERKELLEAIVVEIDKLPPKEAELVRLVYLSDEVPTYEEISKKLGIPVGSIGPTLRRALDKLRKRLGDDFFDLGVFF